MMNVCDKHIPKRKHLENLDVRSTVVSFEGQVYFLTGLLQINSNLQYD